MLFKKYLKRPDAYRERITTQEDPASLVDCTLPTCDIFILATSYFYCNLPYFRKKTDAFIKRPIIEKMQVCVKCYGQQGEK